MKNTNKEVSNSETSKMIVHRNKQINQSLKTEVQVLELHQQWLLHVHGMDNHLGQRPPLWFLSPNKSLRWLHQSSLLLPDDRKMIVPKIAIRNILCYHYYYYDIQRLAIIGPRLYIVHSSWKFSEATRTEAIPMFVGWIFLNRINNI